jgi:hypothetical protein
MIVSIIDLQGKFLYCALKDAITELVDGQIAINKVCTIESENEIFYNFETQEFYIK